MTIEAIIKTLQMGYLLTFEFTTTHWKWLTSFIVGLVGIRISYMAFKHEKITKDNSHQNKEETKRRLIDVAIAEYNRKGEAKSFLTREFNKLQAYGWNKEEFEEIYKDVGFHVKNKEFKNPLFG